MSQQTEFDFAKAKADTEKPTECLGERFPSESARRKKFADSLSAKLNDDSFRNTEGFPQATKDAIIALSDPPYYTACPNPFLAEFVNGPVEPRAGEYLREPFAIDVSVGKTDQLYRAHGYHTKVPHLAIVPSILHYTQPGDIVLDGFCGSGMTGVAAQWCGSAPIEFKQSLEEEWRKEGHAPPVWGPRRAILGDLGPAATFIAANYNIPFDLSRFAAEAERMLREVEEELGWMYETIHNQANSAKGVVNYTVWSQVFGCSECGGEIVFFEHAMNSKTGKVQSKFPCPTCAATQTKKGVERLFETVLDQASGEPWERIKLAPVLINYVYAGEKFEKAPDDYDLEILAKVCKTELPSNIPIDPLPIDQMYHGSRLAPKGFTHVHHLFLARQLQSLSALWGKASAVEDPRIRNMMLYFVEQAIWGMSVLNRYKPIQFGRPGGSQVNNYMSGIYYVSSLFTDCSPHYCLGGKLRRLKKAFKASPARSGQVYITTSDCAALELPKNSIDYVFTDPPFGENLYYADLNFLVEAWHRVFTNTDREAIVDKTKKKDVRQYQRLMRNCFESYYRVLKPGRWMTVVFSNSSNQIWRAIQEAIGTAGFVIADVRTLDKKQGSYRQVTSSAVKQDLVISAYKPTAELAEKFSLDTADEQTAWAFVAEHLKNVPVFVGRSGEEAEPVVERTPQMLHDRMVAFFVQRRMSIPISSRDFFTGLDERYAKREGMYFLPDQVAEYDRKRNTVKELRELDLFVSDEASAIQWLRQQLDIKPQSFQDLQPRFMPQVQTWPKHEKDVDLKELLEQSFLRYDGKGEVPSQIANYLSKNYREFRGVSRENSALKEKAKDRWYVPDPRKTGDLEKLRFKSLIKEFEEYKNSKDRKIKLFRTEAVRAGFKDCYDKKGYQTIIKIAKKLPSNIIEEDEALLMYYDVASMRAGD